jgi:hypothetical protein
LHEFFQVVVKSARTEFVHAFGLASNFLHDSVAVKVVGSQREKDMERRGRKREQIGGWALHIRNPIYRIPS